MPLNTMLDFMPPGTQARLLETLLPTLQADPEVTGVLLAGSFARGDAYPGSDLDVYVLLRAGVIRPFSAQIQEGILVEISYADYEAVKAKFVRKPLSLYTYLDGRILYDAEGHLVALTQVARECLATYHVSQQERQGIAHWLRSACIKTEVARQAEDNLRTAYIVGTNSFEIFAALWAINQRPLPSGAGVLAHLKDLPQQPKHLPNWTHALFCGDDPTRIQTFLDVSAWAISLLETSAAER